MSAFNLSIHTWQARETHIEVGERDGTSWVVVSINGDGVTIFTRNRAEAEALAEAFRFATAKPEEVEVAA